MSDRVLIVDFGSQYSQLIARRIRELHVFCELLPWNAEPAKLLTENTKGIILSGGPNSIYDQDAPSIQPTLLESGLPVLGICYGMQALAHQLGGSVEPSGEHEYGQTRLEVDYPNPLLSRNLRVLMSHGDRITKLPPGWVKLAHTPNSPVAAMADLQRGWFGLQFHPEVGDTPGGLEILRRFAFDICGCQPNWTAASMIEEAISEIRETVGEGEVLSAVSGGLDSAVATALVVKALDTHVKGMFIDTGLMRADEREQVEAAFKPVMGGHFISIDASQRFFAQLSGVTDPETKRKRIGETFIREFEAGARQMGDFDFLCQGTIYPDVIESQGVGTHAGQLIKSHHNVGGLPEDMDFKLVEPLRNLFKDEVRQVGEALGLPHELLWRQPFPGPGLAVRCLGEVTPARVATLRQADYIFTSELGKAGLLHLEEDDNGALRGSSQSFAVLLPVRSVGVMGDKRTYAETICLRAVTTVDFMTADWAKLPMDLLGHVSNRIVNEVPGVNRVVYDITNKPPATIEWE